jgi:hypothetical protein
MFQAARCIYDNACHRNKGAIDRLGGGAVPPERISLFSLSPYFHYLGSTCDASIFYFDPSQSNKWENSLHARAPLAPKAFT